MLDFNVIDGSGELGMNLGLLFFMISAIALPLAHYEQLTAIQNKTEVKQVKNTSQPINEHALLEIACVSKEVNARCDKPVYYWKADSTTQKRETSTVGDLNQWIKDERPTILQLRVDRRLPSGALQDVVLITSPLNIGLELRTQ